MNVKKVLKIALLLLAAAAGVFLSIRYLLPFVIAFCISFLVEKPVSYLQRKTNLPRGACSFVCVLLLMAVVFGILYLLCRIFCTQITEIVGMLPAYAASAAKPLADFKARLYALAGAFPDGLGSGLRAGLDSLFKSSDLVGKKIYEWLFAAASGIIEQLPQILFGTFTTVLASFMCAAQLPNIKTFLQNKLPKNRYLQIAEMKNHTEKTLGHWMLAEIKLAGILFFVITAGLLILSVRYPLLFGLLAALVDALPVFGAGAILIPWSFLLLLQGQLQKAIGMVILYIVTCIARQALEPKLLGAHTGVPPILMLLAIYLGFRLLGVAGLLLFPILVVLGKSFLTQKHAI